MNGDRTVLQDRLTGYGDYTDGDQRANNEERVRAFVGERLSETRDRLEKELGETTAQALEAAILHCQFADMRYIRCLQDARLDAATVMALEKIDRNLVEAAERVCDASAGELQPLIEQIEAALNARPVTLEPVASARASG